MKSDERGSLIIESTFVFPIMFIILLFLIYMGNMFYMRSQVDAIVTDAAVKAASYSADPFLTQIKDSEDVPTKIEDIQPYHEILGDKQMPELRDEMFGKLDRLGTGFFAGMGLKTINIKQFEKKSRLLSSTFIVDVDYKIEFPIRFLGSNEPVVLNMNSRSEVPITDTPEFILNVDMAMDYYKSTGLEDVVNNIKEALPFIN